MFMSCESNGGQKCNIKTASESSENVAESNIWEQHQNGGLTVYSIAWRDTTRHDMMKYLAWLPVAACHCLIVWTTAHYTEWMHRAGCAQFYFWCSKYSVQHILNYMGCKKHVKLAWERNEFYDLPNSKYSNSWFKEKILEENAEDVKQPGKLNRFYLTFLR
jgi:hypothetical protein